MDQKRKEAERKERQMKQKNRGIRLAAAFGVGVMLLAGCSAGKDNGNTSGSAGGSAAEGLTQQSADEDIGDSGAAGQNENAAKMPDFSAKDLEGNTVTESIFGEKDLTVLNIWGTFCNPCVGEMPELGAWAAEMPDNVQLVGLIIDINGEEDTEHHDLAVDITKNANADFTQIIANQDFYDILKDVVGVPTTLFIDKDGNLVGEPILGADVEGYKKFVEDYLGGQ